MARSQLACRHPPDLTMDDPGDLVGFRLAAVLARYRRDGTVLLSPVWHEWRDGGVNVVTGSQGGWARRRRPAAGASLVAVHHWAPSGGGGGGGRPRLRTEGALDAVTRIAS